MPCGSVRSKPTFAARGGPIVNAANAPLARGVDGANPPPRRNCCASGRKLGGCGATGDARYPPYRWGEALDHTVPVWNADGEPERLPYRSSLELAPAHGIRTLAFPAISCGVYGYPMERAAKIAVRECCRFTQEHDAIEQITFALFGADALAIYQAELAQPVA